LNLAVVLLLAIPADARLTLHAGEHRIERIALAAETVETEGPLHAELLPSGNELLLEASAKGLARAFLFARHEVRVIEVAIDTPFPDPGPEPTCATVKDAACYAQFRAHPMPKLTFELEGLQAELKAAQEELNRAGLAHVSVAISPWGVKIKGEQNFVEKRKALRIIWPTILGPFRLDE